MCIRDRPIRNPMDLNLSGKHAPVSYTHLDVYKRQVVYVVTNSSSVVGAAVPVNSTDFTTDVDDGVGVSLSSLPQAVKPRADSTATVSSFIFIVRLPIQSKSR